MLAKDLRDPFQPFTRWLTTLHNSGSRGSDVHFWSLQIPHEYGALTVHAGKAFIHIKLVKQNQKRGVGEMVQQIKALADKPDESDPRDPHSGRELTP